MNRKLKENIEKTRNVKNKDKSEKIYFTRRTRFKILS